MTLTFVPRLEAGGGFDESRTLAPAFAGSPGLGAGWGRGGKALGDWKRWEGEDGIKFCPKSGGLSSGGEV